MELAKTLARLLLSILNAKSPGAHNPLKHELWVFTR